MSLPIMTPASQSLFSLLQQAQSASPSPTTAASTSSASSILSATPSVNASDSSSTVQAGAALAAFLTQLLGSLGAQAPDPSAASTDQGSGGVQMDTLMKTLAAYAS